MKYSTRLICGLTAVATLVAGCGGGPSEEDYAAARTALGEAMEEDTGVAPEFTNEEIDCMAKARDGSVADLAKEVTAQASEPLSDDESAEILSCMSTDTFKTMMTAAFGEDDLAAAGIDQDCVLDTMGAQFEKWKESGAAADDLDLLQGPEVQAEVLKCAADS